MPGERHGTASFPGITAVVDCSLTVSHGITPGTAVLRCLPGPSLPAALGTLQITDGVGLVRLRDCRLEQMTLRQDDRGLTWELALSDRRWRWREQGAISGSYNQLDPNGKLIPWTVRSPTELANLCLDAMGEPRRTVVLPPGLSSADVAHTSEDWLQQGEVFPATGTNPCTEWYAENPARALANLADLYGAVVVWRPLDDSVYVGPPGEGAVLPPGSIARQSPSLVLPELPDGVMVVGAPTRYQLRLLLEPVGLEWDESYRPLDELSYAPLDADGVSTTWANTHPPFLAAAAVGTTLPGAVRATDRLTQTQALALANQSVYRCYRVAGLDVSGAGQILVPGYGRLRRRQQLVLQDTQVEQVRPQPGDANVRTMQPDETLMDLLYNGYSRDRPAEVFGSVATDLLTDLNIYFSTTTPNTPVGSKVYVPFSIDPAFQVVRFAAPVFRRASDGTLEAPDDLMLQTAALVRDAVTNQFDALTAWITFGQSTGSGFVTRRHDDVQRNVFGVYDDDVLVETRDLEPDARRRATYYLEALAASYEVQAGAEAEYNGILPVDLDGAIRQVTWSVGDDGCSTTASRNSEHHLSAAFPPYPARRRAEALREVARAEAEPKRLPSTALAGAAARTVL